MCSRWYLNTWHIHQDIHEDVHPSTNKCQDRDIVPYILHYHIYIVIYCVTLGSGYNDGVSLYLSLILFFLSLIPFGIWFHWSLILFWVFILCESHSICLSLILLGSDSIWVSFHLRLILFESDSICLSLIVFDSHSI